jgi:hypothetical protein
MQAMETKPSHRGTWARAGSSAICAALVAIVMLSSAIQGALGGEDSVHAAVFAAMGIAALGVLLGELGEPPSAPVRWRLYKSVHLLLGASILIVGFWALT